MRPFDPRLLRAAPAARSAVLRLGVIGVLQGIAGVATAFALSALVLAALGLSERGTARDVVGPAVWVVALLAARGLLAALLERVAARAGVDVQTELRTRLLSGWLRRDADARPEHSRALTLAAQGTTAIEPYVARFLPALIAAAAIPVLSIGTLAFVDWPSALIVALTIGLLPVFGALIGMTTRDDTQARWRALSDLAGHYLDVVRGLPTLVSFGRADRQVSTISEVSGAHRRATVRTLRLAFLSSAALELIATISVAIVAVTVGLRLVFGELTLATGLLAILLAPEAYWPVRRVGAEFHSAADGTEALADVLDELDRPSEGDPEAEDSPAGLSARDVVYSYPGAGAPVLDHVSVRAERGLLVITGRSGAGKTTLLEILAGLRRPDSGQVLAGGAVHLVTQRPFLAAGTLLDNLLLGTPASAGGRVRQVLADVGLGDLPAALPDGIDTRIGDDGFGLSAGQRARVVLARAILSEAPIVLLDEPTANLDPVGAEAIGGVVREMARTRTVVAATHRDGLVALADEHLRLDGRHAAEAVSR